MNPYFFPFCSAPRGRDGILTKNIHSFLTIFYKNTCLSLPNEMAIKVVVNNAETILFC